VKRLKLYEVAIYCKRHGVINAAFFSKTAKYLQPKDSLSDASIETF
jgi:hypothetical protein